MRTNETMQKIQSYDKFYSYIIQVSLLLTSGKFLLTQASLCDERKGVKGSYRGFSAVRGVKGHYFCFSLFEESGLFSRG